MNPNEFLKKYDEDISIGLIQTTLDHNLAWQNSPKISKPEEEWAIHEIRKFIAALHQDSLSRKANATHNVLGPDIILLPELSVPIGFTDKLKKMANAIDSIIIAGLDYNTSESGKTKEVRNEAVIIVPSKWRGKKIYPRPVVRYIGKSYAAPTEKIKLKSADYSYVETPDVWIFDGGEIGKFGVAICYDLLDLDRLAMYRTQIQHLFILAYNRDTTSFNHAAEAMARMIFCNVVICNCGYFGGSLSVSPYKEVFKRTIYRHCGPNLATAQVITLPVKSLIRHQLDDTLPNTEFKMLPPGYKDFIEIKKKEDEV